MSLFLVIPKEAAVDEEGGAGGVVGVIGGQERCEAGDVTDIAKALEGDIVQQIVELDGIVEEIFVDGCFDGARGDGIDGDAERGELDAEVASEHFDGAFADAVSGEVREGKFFVDAADVDNFAAGFRDAVVFNESLGDEEEAFEIYVEHEVVIFFGDVPEFGALFDAGIVDEDVDAAKLPFGFGDEAFAVGNFGNVALNGDGLAAVRFKIVDNFLRAGLIGKITDGNGGAVGDKTLGDAESDALIAAGDGRYFSCESSTHV
jgi:hypothetical protein